MNKMLIAIIILLVVFPASAQYNGGKGTESEPYIISSVASLVKLGNTQQDYDKHFILTADVDLTGRVFDRAVIAPDIDYQQSFFQGKEFTGIFDGNNHIISGLTINGASYLGLFGRVGEGAEIRDLGLLDVKISVSVGIAGGLVGENAGTKITSCYSIGIIDGGNVLGGLIGKNLGRFVTRCYSGVDVSGYSLVGGLIGLNNFGDVFQCFSYGGINCKLTIAGGLIGRNDYGTIAECYCSSNVSGVRYVGGLIGVTGSDVKDCYCTGIVRGLSSVGGLVGYQKSGKLINCFGVNEVEVTALVSNVEGTDNTGRLVGDAEQWVSEKGSVSHITGCFWKAKSADKQSLPVKVFKDAGWSLSENIENKTAKVWFFDNIRKSPRLSWELKQELGK